MNAGQLIEHLQRMGVRLWAEGEQLRYAAPKGAITPELRESMAAQKDEMRAILGRVQPVQESEVRLPTIRRDGELPLSAFQRHIWLLEQMHPGQATYNINVTFRTRGPLDVAVITRAFEIVVARHEILRTTCSTHDGRPKLVIHPSMSAAVKVIDLQSLPQGERDAEAFLAAQAEAQIAFRLETGPLVRMAIIKLADEEHWLSLTTHHFIADGVSTRLLFDELAANYLAISRGEEPVIAPEPFQYVDYAAWQEQQIAGGKWNTHLEGWKTQMAGAPAYLDFPTDRQRPPVLTSQGSVIRFAIPESLVERLNALSRSAGATLYMTLLAGFQTLLHRYTRQSDIVLGTAASNRNRTEFEALQGAFTNTLLLRTDLSGDPSFRELIGRSRDTALGAYSRQDLPYVKVVEVLAPPRDPSRNPLFQYLFVLHQRSVADAFALPGVEVERRFVDLGTARFDIGLEMSHTGGVLEGALEYNTDIFDSETMHQFIRSFQSLLEGAVADPSTPISKLPLMSKIEQDALLAGWCRGPEPKRTTDKLIPAIIEERAQQTPDAIAILSDTGSLTYGELNQRSNRLARKLRGIGVRPESRVGVCLRRSPDMVVALLSIWKAGGVYFPIDPDYPATRIEFMMSDTAAEVIITQSSVVDTLPSTGAKIISIDGDWAAIGREEATHVDSELTPDNAAYIIFTSGSTGQPKGVVVCHREIRDYVTDAARLLELTPDDCLLQFFSINFDPSLEQILAPLVAGCRMAIRGESAWLPEEFGRRLREYGVTIAYFTPVVWLPVIRHWNDHPEDGPGAQLRTIIIGGDFIPPESLRLWKSSMLGKLRFLNAYGPTETTIAATVCEVQESVEHGLVAGRLPIGRPLPGRRAYILDQHQNLLPQGVPGELYLGGEGMARGYLNRPDVTEARFLIDPFSTDPHARMYRTGDLAKWLPDGQIEMLGRVDHQVKIRGFRVELGEIEAALARQPGVAEAAVVVKGEHADEKRLAAYVVFRPGESRPMAELRTALKQDLADYMIPQTFTELERMPVSPNGKLDRSALPEPDSSRPEWSQPYVAPRTPIEEIIAETWSEVLKLERVGVHDNFFELGGHSLMATQVVSRLRETFEIELPLRSIFEQPTVERLSLAMLQILAGDLPAEAFDDALLEI